MTVPKKDDKKDTSEIIEVEPIDSLELFSDIDQESIKKSLDAGVILPQLKPILNRVYDVIVRSKPKSFVSNFGKTYAFDVEHDGMLKSLIVPKSLRFQLAVEMKRNNLVDKEGNPDMDKLIGVHMLVQKIIGNTKQYQNAKLYSVQLKL